MTDLLAILVIIAIVVVLLDGVRRKLRDRRGRVVLKLDRNVPADHINLDEIPLSELPNGGARRLERASDEIPVIRRKPPVLPSIKKAREAGETPLGAVPVLMETVEVDEQNIEHTNVFANGDAVDTFVKEEFDEEAVFDAAEESNDAAGFDDDYESEDDEEDEIIDGLEEDEIIDGLDEEYALEARAQQGSHRTGHIVEVDELDDEFDEELEFEVEQQLVPGQLLADADEEQLPEVLADLDDEELDFDEDDDDFEDDETQAPSAGKQAVALDDDDFDEEMEEDDFDDDDEELIDDEDDLYSDEEVADDVYEDEDADDLDSDEDLLDDEYEDDPDEELLDDEYESDYENEPLLLQDVYNKAAGHFRRPIEQQPRIEPGFGGAAFDEDELEEDFSSAFLDDPELNEELQEEMRPIPVAPRSVPRQTPRAEPGFVQTVQPSCDAPAQPTSAESWPPKTAVPVPPSATARRTAAVKPAVKKVDQGELFREENLRKEAAAEQKSEPAGPQEVIIINVMARQGAMFAGADLLPVLRKQGLHLGEMSIFHRHADADGTGQVMFSMANMVKPGTFNLATMESFSTPGVSFFLQLPNKLGNLPSFEKMLAAASAVKASLDGEFKDENRSVFTRQTVEHCRQRIQDFELVLLKHK